MRYSSIALIVLLVHIERKRDMGLISLWTRSEHKLFNFSQWGRAADTGKKIARVGGNILQVFVVFSRPHQHCVFRGIELSLHCVRWHRAKEMR